MPPIESLRAPRARERAIVDALADAANGTSATALRSPPIEVLPVFSDEGTHERRSHVLHRGGGRFAHDEFAHTAVVALTWGVPMLEAADV